MTPLRGPQAMGFGEEQARAALEAAGGDVDAAVGMLCG